MQTRRHLFKTADARSGTITPLVLATFALVISGFLYKVPPLVPLEDHLATTFLLEAPALVSYPVLTTPAPTLAEQTFMPAVLSDNRNNRETTPKSLSIRVQGNDFVDAEGKTIQLRGVNVSGLEFVAIQGWSPANPWGAQTGDQTPNWESIKKWKVNTVRIPLNQASWLGYATQDQNGSSRNPDPGGNYRKTVITSVKEATDAGLYVILDLHWNAPGNASPITQNPMADADHSIQFWTSVANTFKDNSAVMFDLFNEPYFWWIKNGEWTKEQWNVWRDGGVLTDYVAGGNPYQVKRDWNTVGMKHMLDTVRATGAKNVVILSGVDWSNDLTGWVAHIPNDPLRQLAAGWHVYKGQPNSSNYGMAEGVLNAGFPVIITETGDVNTGGTLGAPFVAPLLTWADTRNISYLGWTWDVWQNRENVLIKDKEGTPTDGYGTYFRDHLEKRHKERK